MKKLYLFITIVNRTYGEEFVSFFRAHCRSAVLKVSGEGTASREILDIMGLESTSKTVLFCVVGEAVKQKLFKELKRTMGIDAPGNGIAIAAPMSSITLTGIEHLSPEFEEWASQKETTAEERKMEEAKYQLIVVIAENDSVDEIMSAAREAGAGGGTRIHAKGTAPEDVKKFFGVNLSEDKEMLFIAAKSEDRKAIMRSVARVNGEGKTRAVSFSLPVDTVAGIFDPE